MIAELIAASQSNVPFSLAWKRARHLRYGHPFTKSEHLDKMRTESHPANDQEFIYTVNLRQCLDCGLTYLDAGLEFRKPLGANA